MLRAWSQQPTPQGSVCASSGNHPRSGMGLKRANRPLIITQIAHYPGKIRFPQRRSSVGRAELLFWPAVACQFLPPLLPGCRSEFPPADAGSRPPPLRDANSSLGVGLVRRRSPNLRRLYPSYPQLTGEKSDKLSR